MASLRDRSSRRVEWPGRSNLFGWAECMKGLCGRRQYVQVRTQDDLPPRRWSKRTEVADAYRFFRMLTTSPRPKSSHWKTDRL